MLANLQKLLMPYWLQFQQQTGANPRLRWMLWGILYIFLIYFALSLGEWRAEQQQSIDQAQRTMVKLDQLESQTEWPERWDAEKEVGAQLRQRLWTATSIGLAEADLQNFLRDLINNLNGEDLRMRLAPTEAVIIGGKSLFKVSADLSAMIPVTQADSFMRALAEHPQSLVVERFSYSPQRGSQINMLITAYFIHAEKNSDAAAEASQ